MDFLEVPHFVELLKLMGKNLRPPATPRDLLSRIARALRRGASGRLLPGVPRHCAGRVARRRPGETQIQPVTLGIQIGIPGGLMGTHLPTLP